jgi:adenosine deaminase CECR1
MVGAPSMTVHGWKQLAEWSIEYSCLSPTDQAAAIDIFHREWEAFCLWIDAEYGADADLLKITPETEAMKA